LLPGLTAQENVEMPLYVRFGRRHARNRAREMLHLVGLDQVEILSAQIQTVAPEALVVQSSDISNVRQRALQNLFIFVVAVTSFAFIAAVVLITNMVSLTLAERRRAFAIQKAVGFSRGQVLIMLVLEYALLGLTAAGGAIGALVVTTALINTLQPSAQLVFPPELSLLIATITIATAALSAILVTWRTVHVPPLEALREH
jgi:ABC-type antimicrobial peptide transport system permease subunit